MAFKFVILALALAYANAGNLIAEPAHAVHYSSAPAVSSSYFNQASAPVAHAKTLAVATPAYASAPAYAYQAAPAVAYQSAPHAVAYQSAPHAVAYQTAPQHAVAYQTAPHAVAVHAPSVGYSQQAVSKSLGGAQSVSTYSKAVDSAFSSVRKYDTRITNDGVSYAPAQLAYSAPLVTKAYAAPVAYTAQAPVAYAAHSPVAYAAQSPVAYTSHAPVVTKTYAAPQVYSYGAPIAKAVAPVATYAAHAPVHYAAAPAVSYGAPAQLVTKSAVSYAPAVAHTTFQGYGVEYHY